MAVWFHRNMLKATVMSNFDFKLLTPNVQASKLISDLKESRYELLRLLPVWKGSTETVHEKLKTYTALLRGVIIAPDGSGAPSKLRYTLPFKWTHSLFGPASAETYEDAVFEIINILMNTAIWYMKHAGSLCLKQDFDVDEDAKEVHKSLRTAGGLFQFVEKELLPKVNERAPDASDLDPRIIHAYLNQATAEAQEVTVARAVEMQHNVSIISALANETAKLFHEADASLGTIESKPAVAQWRKYLQLKQNFYLAYAYTYCGENLLGQDKCGEAIRALREAEKHYEKSNKLCKEYTTTKGPMNAVRPSEFAFYKKLGLKFKLTLEKCERENGFIYHQKVPNDPPVLESKATYGLASPIEFTTPDFSPLWTPASYDAIDATPPSDGRTSKAAAKVEGDLQPVNEGKMETGKRDPKGDVGCSIQ